ncbi:Potassium voltage-gated channel subfamily KQT member 1 [Acipenser ruthenus]|uniref:Potassium voltage-gated channel subfamily KQT member 1 n=1 Tax=Acipenser ruthenus TaxID=7906 RepID=A0A662YLU7_ACIRT|nr:Potassium voltage-gated channel subfamily KQT member 1 [Acipenser ruthenus]
MGMSQLPGHRADERTFTKQALKPIGNQFGNQFGTITHMDQKLNHIADVLNCLAAGLQSQPAQPTVRSGAMQSEFLSNSNALPTYEQLSIPRKNQDHSS